ncbi:MAG: DNA repair protein RadA [Candidatus Omnitrophica bacterium]|nr:DNA repair protein RadA [Candidatus Omnitrophota bacterium]
MVKTKTIFVCQSCGMQSSKWQGKCANCESWNSYVEEAFEPSPEKRAAHVFTDEPVLLTALSKEDEERASTDILELDRVLGGGLVKGSVTLLGGDPGIGKSTLSLQMAFSLAKKGSKVLYISGEESIQQTKLRSKRLQEQDGKNIYIVNQVDLTVILSYLNKMKLDFVVIDSIQVLFNPDLTSTPGSVSQVRECSATLTNIAKSKGISLLIIGHVTKDGMLAGPRVMEHIVDTVLYFEGERYSTYRILRSVKNRFGSTNEIGVFEMTAGGLIEVNNPSVIFLSERAQNSSGSVVVPIIEGTRPILVEIQGLVSRASFGMVRQKAQGFDGNRLALLVAVLEKRLGLNLYDKDIFLNVVGGVKIMDPAADLAVTIAIASALLDKPVSFETVVLGEVGLSAEVRSVSQIQTRINEAEKLGFKKCIIPRNNLKSKVELTSKNMEIIPVETVKEAKDILERP